MNNLNLSEDQQRALLELAGQKLGKDPSQLKAELESGQLDSVLNNIDSQKKAQIGTMLNNPGAIELLLKNEQLRNLLTGLMGGRS